jgi:superfamily I DNA/RNA helicase
MKFQYDQIRNTYLSYVELCQKGNEEINLMDYDDMLTKKDNSCQVE